MHFFDYNATTPLCGAAREAWLAATEASWLNPSSPYRAAAAVRVRLDALREELAALVQVDPARLVFNSGATEGNNAVFRHWSAVLPADARIGISPVEHPSVLAPARHWFAGRIEWLPIDHSGRVLLEQLDLAPLSAVSVMAANNETGVCQPWPELAKRCREKGISYHCDASQWLGKMDADGLSSCDFLTGCAHKFCGPRGVGFLAVPESTPLSGALLGGQQQGSRRAGTEDVAGVAAMVAALAEVERYRPHCCSEGKAALLGILTSELPGAFALCRTGPTLWNTQSLCLPEFASARWIRGLEKRGFLVSAGSACSTGHSGPSHVLDAMGIPPADASRVLRVSAGWTTGVEAWESLARAILATDADLRSSAADSPSRVISI